MVNKSSARKGSFRDERRDNVFSRARSKTREGEGGFKPQSDSAPRAAAVGEDPAARPEPRQAGVARYPSAIDEQGRHSGEEQHTYRRSDEELLAELTQLLQEDDTVDISRVSLTVKEGSVYLEGLVESEYSRELIVETAAGLMDVGQVVSKLEIDRAPQSDSLQLTGQTGLKSQLSGRR